MKNKALMAVSVLALYWIFFSADEMPEVTLATYSAQQGAVQQEKTVGGACRADKCLTVYVAPWCPACKQSVGMINNLVDDLKKDGLEAHVIVGHDEVEKLQGFGKRFRVPVLLDPDKTFFETVDVEAVPYFAVTDGDGTILEEMRGANTSVQVMRDRLNI